MMICPKCGSENEDDAPKCRECSFEYNAENPKPKNVEKVSDHKYLNNLEGQEKCLRRLPLFFRILAYLTLLTAAIFMMLQMSGNGPDSLTGVLLLLIGLLITLLGAILWFIAWTGLARLADLALRTSSEIRYIKNRMQQEA